MRAKSKLAILLVSVVLMLVLACGKTAPIPSATIQTDKPPPPTGDSEHTLTLADEERSYVLHIPPIYDPTHSAALVIAFHGITLDAYEMMRISGFNAQADSNGFIVVYPNASGAQKSWNGGHCCGEAARNGVDDVGYIRTLITELSELLNIDPKRIYATGFSNGAILTYRLACELSTQFAAIAPVSATPALEDLEACQPTRPMPLIHFHGTADEPNPYYGGVTPGGIHFTSVADVIRFWGDFDGCPSEPQRSESGSIIHETYTPCQYGSTIELYTIVGGKHAWPGGEAVNQRMGEPTREIFATALMWDFFLKHPLP